MHNHMHRLTKHTLLAGVKVPSTSNRQMVPCTGRSCRAGKMLAASVDMMLFFLSEEYAKVE